MLNFIGLAALLPILYLILDSDSIHSNRWLHAVYIHLGFDSAAAFATAVSCAMVAFIAVKCAVNIGLYRFERDYIYALYRYLSRNLYIRYFNRGLSFIKNSNSAILARNVNVVCYTFVAGILRPMASILSEAMLFALLFGAIAFYSPLAALLSGAIFVPSVCLYYVLMRKRIHRYGTIENEAQRRKSRKVIETYRGYADIELNNAFARMLASFDQSTDTIIEVGAKDATVSTLPQHFIEIGVAAGMALLVSLSVGEGGGDMKVLFGAFAVAALRLLPSIRSIMAAWTAIRHNKYAIDIIAEADISAEEQAEDGSAARFDFREAVEVQHLSFRFEGDAEDTLHDLSFTIRRGDKIGIRGRSGAGKTTLFNLLLGFYEPTGGAIFIDGERLSAENRRKWQNTIGYVSQHVFLTDDTILANIAFGCDEASVDMERIRHAVDMANLREFVDSLPNGLHTGIGECGARLSGGQRQRIGIARALYKRADILFFDEATSSLDNETERSINESIADLSRANRELTIVVIAHRESSLDYCDRIITIPVN